MGKIVVPGKEILIPRVVVRPLLPPPPTFSARLQPQHLHWQVGRYKERLTSGPGGLGRGKIWVVEKEAEQHNLILTQTYDALIGSHGFGSLANYAVVGTGSTPPNATQTGLVAEVARTNAGVSGEPDTIARQSTSGPGVGTFIITNRREFTEAQVGGRNLTEWGFSPSNSAGNNLMTRELFRDGLGNPVVISLASDQRLRLIYAYQVSYSPNAGAPQDASINIANLGTFAGKVFATRYYNGSDSGMGDLHLLSWWAMAYSVDAQNSLYFYPLDAYKAPNLDSQFGNYSSPVGYQITSGMFTAITRGRKINAITIPATDYNRDIYGFAIIRYSGSNHVGGFALAFNSGVKFTKSNLYKLVVGEWTLTWGP